MFAGKTTLRCDCGYELPARREEDQVAEIRRHALEAHGIAFSAEEALAILLRSELESSGELLPTPGGRDSDDRHGSSE